MKSWVWPSAVVAGLILSALRSTAAAIEPISYCGQSFRGRGVLVGDLDCRGFNGPGVVIEIGRLDLAGFTIFGSGYFGVQCLSSCQIVGPGTITANERDGVYVGKYVILRDVSVTNNGINGVFARNVSERGRVIMKRSTISGNGINGIETDVAVVMRDSVVADNGEHGIDLGTRDCDSAGRLLMYDSHAMGNGQTCAFNDVCADLTSCGVNNQPPRLSDDSSCTTSHVRLSSPGMSHGVCNGD
jgi:hypothetical protein